MNKKIFISYGNAVYSQSLERIRKEAEDSGEFDEVIIYTDETLPAEIKNHKLFKYQRGGGYWLWKPYICMKTLEICDESDIVVYSDGGNKIYNHPQWKQFWKWMDCYNGVFFYYGALMVERSRRSLIDRFINTIPSLKKMFQIQSGVFILSKASLPVMRDWYYYMFNYPEDVIDATDDEKENEYPQFIESRHDQAVLSCVVFKHWNASNLKVTRQRSERYHRGGQAVFNARISNDKVRNKMVFEPLYILLLRKLLVEPYRFIKMQYYKSSILK